MSELARVLIAHLVRRARSAPPLVDDLTGTRLARYPAVTQAVVVSLGALLVSGATLVACKVPVTARVGATWCAVLCGLAAAAMAAEFVCVSLAWTTERITFSSPWRGTRHLRWEEIASVEYSPVAGWFLVKDSRGVVIRPAMMLGGLEEFFQELKRRGHHSLQAPIDHAVGLRAERAA